MEIIEEKKFKIKTNNKKEMELILRNYNNKELSITLFTMNDTPSKKYELKYNFEEFQKIRFFKIFINIQEIMKELSNKIENSVFIEDTNCIIIDINIGLTIINEVILIIEEQEKTKDEIIDELEKKIKILENKLNEKEKKDAENKINSQTNTPNETKSNNNNFKNLKIENLKNIKILNNNKGIIYCVKTLDDGRIAAGDEYSNLIIYNKETFYPDIIIRNNLNSLLTLTQLKNKNIICSFSNISTLKIIKIMNNEYENIQIIKGAHNNDINKIIELKNEKLITFSYDYSFKIWKLNKYNNKYEKIYKFIDTNKLSDGIEIKDNEIILYALNTNPQSLVFYDLNKNEKIRTIYNLNLCIDCLCRISKINENEVVVAGNKKVYLIDVNNYLILYEINSEYLNFCILKLSNDSFLIGDEKGTVIQYKIDNKKLIKESFKNKSYNSRIYTMTIFDDGIISGGYNEIKIWKN